MCYLKMLKYALCAASYLRLLADGRPVRARSTVLATGPWTCLLAGLRPEQLVRFTKGVHIEVPTLGFATPFSPDNIALLFTAPQDGRVFFANPWKGRTLVGTTDTFWEGDPDEARAGASVRCSAMRTWGWPPTGPDRISAAAFPTNRWNTGLRDCRSSPAWTACWRRPSPVTGWGWHIRPVTRRLWRGFLTACAGTPPPWWTWGNGPGASLPGLFVPIWSWLDTGNGSPTWRTAALLICRTSTGLHPSPGSNE